MKPENLIIITVESPSHRLDVTLMETDLADFFGRMEFPSERHAELVARAQRGGDVCFIDADDARIWIRAEVVSPLEQARRLRAAAAKYRAEANGIEQEERDQRWRLN